MLSRLVDRRRYRVGPFFQARDSRGGQNGHALVFELFLHKCGNFCVLNGQDTPHNLRNRHVYAQGVIEACEFNADGA